MYLYYCWVYLIARRKHISGSDVLFDGGLGTELILRMRGCAEDIGARHGAFWISNSDAGRTQEDMQHLVIHF